MAQSYSPPGDYGGHHSCYWWWPAWCQLMVPQFGLVVTNALGLADLAPLSIQIGELLCWHLCVTIVVTTVAWYLCLLHNLGGWWPMLLCGLAWHCFSIHPILPVSRHLMVIIALLGAFGVVLLPFWHHCFSSIGIFAGSFGGGSIMLVPRLVSNSKADFSQGCSEWAC